ncbi:MAG TPA: branched-chain amino acid ABC transporter substrate-binding protein [Rhodocyclaceae bacterium]|nr:branched-chain amino acid ABC transporter substrate-binding protein [Rhodocyclaceae bacterium]HMV53700.1 branched-chain amino acid ABC transporter substrate-binding protein [Rhodocyclaceae bacterium]HMZ84331.1 branched-chain amino acid ABC transporter substrate-binding protein [Rhodocyclaceae bacterium]HNA03394.1 branched-chain amino acid ABC transporter substrate-binding protein [Rhodocyclaceae bacterium]HNB77722.1 branched-chain amino acid ABC transporter substrate-binding protein [Rhodocy
MKFPIRNLVLVLLGAGVLAACGKKEERASAATRDSEVSVVRIGAASPLTGPQAHIGIDIKNGTQLAVDDINASGLTIGGKKVKLELLAEDDEANPTKATTVAQKLVDAKVVAVVGHFNSGASIPASKIYSDAGVVQISPGSTNPKYTQQGFKTTYRVVANDDQQGPVCAQYAVGTLGAKNIAVIDDSTAYGQGLANAFEAKATALGATIVAHEHTTDKDTDFTAILTAIKSKNPDLVFFGGIDTQAGPMAKQMAGLGIKAKLLGGDGMQTPNFLKLAGDASEGAMASIPGLPKEKMPGGKTFLDKFKAKFNAEVELFAPMGYDAVFVIVEAMKRAGSADPARILAEMPKTQLNGVIGPIAFDEKGDLKDGPLTIYAVKSGKWEAIETVGGNAAAIPAAASDSSKPAGDKK